MSIRDRIIDHLRSNGPTEDGDLEFAIVRCFGHDGFHDAITALADDELIENVSGDWQLCADAEARLDVERLYDTATT